MYSPKGNRKIRIEHNASQSINIQSNIIKRLELEHIEDAIEKMVVIPDFGYNIHVNENISEIVDQQTK